LVERVNEKSRRMRSWGSEQQTLSANRNQPALRLLITRNEIISASFDKVDEDSAAKSI
jgi:hypothetical protein